MKAKIIKTLIVLMLCWIGISALPSTSTVVQNKLAVMQVENDDSAFVASQTSFNTSDFMKYFLIGLAGGYTFLVWKPKKEK